MMIKRKGFFWSAMGLLTLVLSASAGQAATGTGRKVDKRLATVRSAYVVALDQNSGDREIVSCLSSHLDKLTRLHVATKPEADVIVKVSSQLRTRTPRAFVVAELPDGTKLWDDAVKYPNGRHYGEPKTDEDFASGVACGLADQLAGLLNDAVVRAAGASSVK